MGCIEKEPIYNVYCIGRRQNQRYLMDVSVAQLVASMSGVVLGGVAMRPASFCNPDCTDGRVWLKAVTEPNSARHTAIAEWTRPESTENDASVPFSDTGL